MAKTTITLAPDLYYHRWGEPDGELWVCLRAFVTAPISDDSPTGDLKNFKAWVESPHDGTKFDYSDPPAVLTGCRFDDKQRLIPINLPTQVDLWAQVHYDGTSPAPWLRIARDAGCMTSPAALPNDVQNLFSGGTRDTPDPTLHSFSHWFNQTACDKWKGRSEAEQEMLAGMLELRMESGKLVPWACEQQIKQLYRNEADASRPALPLFNPSAAWTTGCQPGASLTTNLYWLCGLMFPLGRKPVEADLNKITGVDICLVTNDVALGTPEPPQTKILHFMPAPPLVLSTAPAAPYFAAIENTFSARLVSTLFRSPVAASAQTAAADTAITYVSPALHGMSQDRADPARWHVGTNKAPAVDAASSALDDDVQNPGKLLGRLAALEVRTTLPLKGDPSTLKLNPMVTVSGALRVYRRFPQIPAPGKPLATVMLFEPDPTSVGLVELVRTKLGEGGLTALFASADIDGWDLTALTSDPLPWDGPARVYRVLATPSKKAVVTTGFRTLAPAPVTLAIVCPSALVARSKPWSWPIENGSDPRRWFWSVGDGVTSDTLAADWAKRLRADGSPDGWSSMTVNGFLLNKDLPAEKGGVSCLFLDDYTFELADSRTRLERYLRIETDFPDGDPGACGQTFSPIEDFEDDLANFNTASMVDSAGNPLDANIRFAQNRRPASAVATTRNLHRSQVIPLVIEWAREPGNVTADPGGARQPASLLTWQELRNFVASATVDDLPIEPFGARLEHTYGTHLPCRDGQDAPLVMRRASSFATAVDSPTAAEGSGKASAPGTSTPTPDIRFLTCAYSAASGELSLLFDETALDPAAIKARCPDLANVDYNLLALSAWRAVGELAVAKTLTVNLDLLRFDLGMVAGEGIPSAAALSLNGFSGNWSKALRASTPEHSIDIPGAIVSTWARQLLDQGATTMPQSPPLRLQVDGQGAIGSVAHVARARLVIERSDAVRPPRNITFRPITRQAGLFTIAPDSLLGVWGRLGFGPSISDSAADVDLAAIGGAPFVAARQAWIDRHSVSDDSITPAPVQREAGAKSKAATALIAELDGTDWFAPEGHPHTTGLGVRPVLVPFGFAPCAPHPTLAHLAQPIIQRVLAALRDAVDVAYVSWATDGTDWPALFSRIASLAYLDNGRWAGPLPTLLSALVTGLLLPQPDATDPQTDTDIQAIAAAYRDKKGQVAHLREAVVRMLLSDPALYADNKALLLTKMVFEPVSSVTASPPPESIARARFSRQVRPAQVATDSAPAMVASVAGWSQLVAAGTVDGGAAPPESRFAFLETLDDARYDNAFHVARAGQMVESFEQMIDPDPVAGVTQLEWHPLPPKVPSSDENGQADDAPREVRLASRAIVSPPELLWSGSPNDQALPGTSLAKRLDSLAIGKTWSADWLHIQLRDESGQAAKLQPVAFRPTGDRPPNVRADEDVTVFVYRVRGDEETGVDIDDSFANDSFSVSVTRAAPGQSFHAEALTFKSLDKNLEAILRRFLDLPGGAPETADLIENSGFDPALFAALTGLAQTYVATPPPADAAGLYPDLANHVFAVSGTVAPRIRDVALFRPAVSPAAGPVEPTAYLLVSVILDTWSGWDVQVAQNRNMPVQPLGPVARSRRQPARFAAEFWQSEPQATAPVTQNISLQRRNQTMRWNRNGYFLTLNKAMVDTPVSIDQLVSAALYNPAMTIDGVHAAGQILSPDSRAQIYRNRLSVTVYQEQCEGPGAPPREVRFPFPTVSCLGAAEAAQKFVVFPGHYQLLSIDFHWFNENGSSRFSLERLFVQIP